MRKYAGILSRAALAAGVDRKTFRKLLKKSGDTDCFSKYPKEQMKVVHLNSALD